MTTIETNKKFKCPFTPAIIDFTKEPKIPEHHKIHLHNSHMGIKQLSHMEFALFTTWQQKEGKIVDGGEIYRKLLSKVLYPANLLDHFLLHPEDIPDELKGDEKKPIYTFFWGTYYMNSDLQYCVRGIYFKDHQWKECIHAFDPYDLEKDESWPSNCLALIEA